MTTYQTGFVYGQPILDQTIVVRVFDWWTLSLIIITYFILFLLSLRKQDQAISKALNVVQKFMTLERFPRNPFLLLGYFEIYLLYSAAFRSQTISSSLTSQPFSTQKEFMNKLYQRNLEILIEDVTMLPAIQEVYP